MRIVNIHEAKTHLSKLIEAVLDGETLVIARAGRPLVKVVPLDTPGPDEQRRLGFLEGQFQIPDDFDELGRSEIEALFGASE